MTGRPTDFTPEIALAICSRLVEGESLRKICKDESMPGKSTVFQWLESDEKFADQYARARAMLVESLADDLVDIADVGSGDVNRDRLSIDTRKWIASKLKPKKYGDKIEHEHSGNVTVKAGPLDEAI